MALEGELAALRQELATNASEARSHIQATHRQYRRDLVPVSNTIELFIDASRRAHEGS